uniref:Uncharacterized protein n=1 Tax=Romanomermis culicivorax TaxID=13658 RepID=A0A915IHG1_ROMCU
MTTGTSGRRRSGIVARRESGFSFHFGCSELIKDLFFSPKLQLTFRQTKFEFFRAIKGATGFRFLSNVELLPGRTFFGVMTTSLTVAELVDGLYALSGVSPLMATRDRLVPNLSCLRLTSLGALTTANIVCRAEKYTKRIKRDKMNAKHG